MNTKETEYSIPLCYSTKKEEKARITLIHVCFISRTLGTGGKWRGVGRVKRRVQEPKEKGDKKGFGIIKLETATRFAFFCPLNRPTTSPMFDTVIPGWGTILEKD